MFFPLLASSINHCSRHCKKIDDDRKIDTETDAFMALIRNPTPKMKFDIFHLHRHKIQQRGHFEVWDLQLLVSWNFLELRYPIGKFQHCLLAIRTGTIMAMTMSLSLLVLIAMMTRLTCTTTGSILGSNLFATMWFCWLTCKMLMVFLSWSHDHHHPHWYHDHPDQELG